MSAGDHLTILSTIHLPPRYPDPLPRYQRAQERKNICTNIQYLVASILCLSIRLIFSIFRFFCLKNYPFAQQKPFFSETKGAPLWIKKIFFQIASNHFSTKAKILHLVSQFQNGHLGIKNIFCKFFFQKHFQKYFFKIFWFRKNSFRYARGNF